MITSLPLYSSSPVSRRAADAQSVRHAERRLRKGQGQQVSALRSGARLAALRYACVATAAARCRGCSTTGLHAVPRDRHRRVHGGERIPGTAAGACARARWSAPCSACDVCSGLCSPGRHQGSDVRAHTALRGRCEVVKAGGRSVRGADAGPLQVAYRTGIFLMGQL